MSRPSLAVVMPYYKNERTLNRCLRALAAQNCDALSEVIVVDDGGPVRAADIVKSSETLPNLQILQTPNLGQSAATNCAIRASSADIIVLICADIIARPNFLAAHLSAHQSFCEPICVCGHIAYPPWLKLTPFMRYLEEPNVQFDFRPRDNPDCIPGSMLYAPNASARREDLTRAGLFDEKLLYGFQDVDLGIRLSSLGVRLVYRQDARVLHDHPNTPDQFFERQVRVGRMLPHIFNAHPNNAVGRRFVNTLERTLHLLPKAQTLLGKMREFEARAQALPQHFEELKESLFYFYHVVMLLGFVKGALQTGNLLRDLLGISDVLWEKYCGQIADFSLSQQPDKASLTPSKPATTPSSNAPLHQGLSP